MSGWKVYEYKTLQVQRSDNVICCVFFTRYYEDDWGYMGMRDYKTEEPTNRFILYVTPYINKYACNSDAGKVPGSFISKEFDKDMANKIYLNIKKRKMTYEQLVASMELEDLIQIKK